MPDRRLLWLGIGLILACCFYLFWGLSGAVAFILELRATRLWSLILIGAGIGAGTVVFQTVTGNRILTPAIMGFDSLFLMIQTLGVFVLGSSGYVGALGPAKFLFDVAVMILAAILLFSLLLGRGGRDIHRMILVGVVIGLLFRSLTSFLLRLIDPSEFSVVQSAMFASFGAVDPWLLTLSTVLMVPVIGALLVLSPKLDVVALGRDTATGLGLPYDWFVLILLGMVAVLVAVSTALVGPITFLGLLVASLAHELMRSHRHALLLPAAILIAALTLVVGQAAFERVLGLQSTLAVLIEFFGGLLFLILVMRGAAR